MDFRPLHGLGLVIKVTGSSVWFTGSKLKTFPDPNELYNRSENDMVYIRPNNRPNGYYFRLLNL